jgi:hypothetical protein
VNKADVLVAHDLNLVDRAEAAEVVAELFLGRALVEATEVDVTTCIGL